MSEPVASSVVSEASASSSLAQDIVTVATEEKVGRQVKSSDDDSFSGTSAEKNVELENTDEDSEEPIRLADESGSESGEINLASSGGGLGGHNRSHSSSSDNFTDARMDTPDNEENASSSCLPSIPSELQLDSLPLENGGSDTNGNSNVNQNSSDNGLTASIAKIDEIDEDFKTPDVEVKAFAGETEKGSDRIDHCIPAETEPCKKKAVCTSAEKVVETPELCNSGSIHEDLENLEDYGDEQFVSDVGESIQVKNVEVDMLNMSSKSQEDKVTDSSQTAAENREDIHDEEDDDDLSDSSMINSIDRATSSESPHSPHHEGFQRRRNSSSVQMNLADGDVFPNEQIIDYLVDVNDDAEARLAARRQARAEAREIRMKELEKQQKENDDSADRHYDMYSTGTPGGDVVNRAAFRVALGSHRAPSHSVGSASYHSSRRSSEDSSEDGMVSIRDMRHELKELEDKFRKSMVQNAQLDNEKSALTYQVELLKDKIEDLEESLTLLQREYRDKCRDFENLKRLSTQIKDELEYCKAQLLEKEELIKEYGLVVVENEVEVDLGNGEKEMRIKRSLVTQETAQVLTSLGSGSLDVRLKKFLEEKNDLLDQIRRLTIELEEERNKHSKGDRGGAQHNASNSSAYTNGPGEDSIDAHKDASKQLADYRFKTQKCEQEIATLQANVARLDGQVTRFKTAAEEAESREDDLKIEKRKLQRELREAQSKLDELETTNSHLQKRLDKLKTAKSTLLKEL